MQPRRTAILSIADASYLAGLIDGEGTIPLTRLHRGHTYAVANRQALALLEQVAPFPRSYKSSRAQLVLNDYLKLTPRNGKYDNCLLAGRSNFEQRFAAISVRRKPGDSERKLPETEVPGF